MLGHANVGILVLDGDEFAVLRGPDSVQQGMQVDAVAIDLVNLDFAALETVAVDGWQDLFGQFQGNVDADGLFLGVGIIDADVQPAVLLGGIGGLPGAILRKA